MESGSFCTTKIVGIVLYYILSSKEAASKVISFCYICCGGGGGCCFAFLKDRQWLFCLLSMQRFSFFTSPFGNVWNTIPWTKSLPCRALGDITKLPEFPSNCRNILLAFPTQIWLCIYLSKYYVRRQLNSYWMFTQYQNYMTCFFDQFILFGTMQWLSSFQFWSYTRVFSFSTGCQF